ncbi:MAG: hypothetical protein KY428_12985, partial [Bacteroidetes bacterium]|nr:hypothetical protein [Bacteroidota bacterium]
MAFKGIEDRFASKASGLYRKYSTKDGSKHHPLLEWKPDDPEARETQNDSRMLPIGSVKRDVKRIGGWSTSGQGLLFMLRQGALQTANKFSETRLINPLFVVGNLAPGLHIKRAVAVPSQFALRGDSDKKSPGSANIGSAGRLQRETSSEAIANLMGNGGRNNIFSYLPTPSVVKSVMSVFSLKNRGGMGINERPELDFNDTYFSIAVWKGFRRTNGFRDNLDSASANLRVGNFKGALRSLQQSARDVERQLRGSVPSGILPAGSNLSNSGTVGKRYFITDSNNADRYLNNTVLFTTTDDGLEHSAAQLSFMVRTPYVVGKGSVSTEPTSFNLNTGTINNIRSGISSFINGAQAFNSSFVTRQAINRITSNQHVELDKSANPAEDAMLFGDESLRKKYESDERLTFIRDQIKSQKDAQTDYWKANRSDLAFGGGWYSAGQEINIDPRIRNHPEKSGHFFDKINNLDVLTVSRDEPSSQDISAMYTSAGGRDLINLWFYDFASSEIIPFRAYVSGLSESVNPEFNETRYIG